MLIPFAGSYFTGRLFDQGFANLMGLETLRHGTDPLAWVGIHLFGTLPQLNKEVVDDRLQSHQYHLWWDGKNKDSNGFAFLTIFATAHRVMPRTDSWTKTYKGLKSKGCPKILAALMANLIAIFVPPIRIRASAEHAQDLLIFESSTKCATNGWVSPLHFGTVGTVWNSLTPKMPWRIFKEPKRLLTGIFQLAVAGSLVHTIYRSNPAYFTAHKTVLITGTILGMI